MLIIRCIGGMVLSASLLAAGCGRKAEPTEVAAKQPLPSVEHQAPLPIVAATNPPTVVESATNTPAAKTNEIAADATVVMPVGGSVTDTSEVVRVAFDASFALDLQRIYELEQDAQFQEAIRLCKTFQDSRKDPEQQKALYDIMLRLTDERAEAVDLRLSVRYLSSENQSYIQVAQEKLSNAGETGRIFLRKVVREDKDAAALIATRLLIEQADAKAYPLFAVQLARREFIPLLELMAQGMNVRIDNVQTNAFVTLHETILCDTNFVRRESAGVLVTAFEKRCRGAVEPYNQLIGATNAFETLRTYLENAMLSTDTQVVAWVCGHGGSLAGAFSTAVARYYADTQFGSLTNERPESQIAISGYNTPPFPGGPSENFSARWTGFLDIPKAGTYTFYASADDGGSVSVGTQILAGVVGSGTNMTVELKPGWVPISADLVQVQHGYGIRVDMSGPDMPRRLVDGGVLRSPPWKDAVLPLRQAIRDLTATNWITARAAKARLAWGFTAGDIYLRDALRNESDPVAARAAEWLVARRDTRAPAILIERIEKYPASPVIPELTVALRNMAPILAPDQIQYLYKTMLQDADASMLPHASALCALLNDVYGNDKTRFNQAVQDPKGYDQLQRYVQQATISAKDTVVVNACEYGIPFTPYLTGGLRGQYFYGQQFDELALERLEGRFELNDRSNPNPLPENRRGDSSLRWTGFLRIDTAAAYTFYSRSGGNSALFIDDRPVVNNWDWNERSGAPVTLEPGWHRMKAEGAVFEMSWSWTNVAKQIIAGNIFRTPIWRSALLTLPPAIDNLASTNLATMRAAAATLAQAQEFAPIFLRNAIRHKPDSMAKTAAAILTERNDAPTAVLLIERIRKTPDSAIVPDLLENLRSLAANIPPDLVPSLCEAIGADKDSRMIPEASILCIILDRLCSGKVEEFNKLAKDPKAHEQLKSYVEQACATTNDAVVMRAAQFGAPFVAPASGLRGRYYLGAYFEELTLDRLDPVASIPDRSYPWPSNQMKNVSVQWDGWLNVERAGDYTFDLNSGAWQGISIDGVPVQFQGEWNRRTNKVAVAAGVHRIRVTLQQGRDGWDWDIGGQLDWAGPGFGRRIIGPEALRTPLWPDALARLPGAINNLTSTNWAEVRTAKAVLLQAGDAGMTFLRNAIRYKPDPAAKAAAAILSQQNDAPAAALLVERIRKTPASAIVPDLLDNLRDLAVFVPADSLPFMLEAIRADKDVRMIPEAAMLCFVLDRTCGGNAESFNGLVKDPKAYEQLQGYVTQALASSNDAVVMSACRFGPSFVAPVPGLRGSYYLGQQRDELATERADASVSFRNQQYPVPANWQRDLSARWSGTLLVTQPGDYVIWVERAQAQAQLRIDERNLSFQQVPGDQNSYTNTITLAKGTHRIRLDAQLGGDWNQLTLYWNGPGIGKQIIPPSVLRTPLWQSELAKLPGAINSLTSTNWAEVRAAKATLLQSGDAGLHFLRNAIRHKPDAVAKAAAAILAEQYDASAAPLLVERIRKTPASAIVPDLLENLRDLAAFILADSLPALLEAVRADKDVRMIPEAAMLCIVLDRACGGNAESFNGLVKDPKAYEQLQGYVTQALASSNDAVVMSACRFGPSFVAPVPGLRGSYYLGQQRDELATERADASVSFRNQQYPVPANWQRDLSARWSGTLLVTQPGDYVIWVERAQAQAQLRIDERNLSFQQVPGDQNSYTNTITLAKGTHRIRLDAQLGGDWNQLTLYWNGPGIGKQIIPPSVLRTPLWQSELAKLPGAINSLTSTNWAEVRAAKATLLQSGDAGLHFLRNAIRYKPDPVAKAAAAILAEQYDALAAALLVERIRKAPDSAIVPDLFDSLRELGGFIPPDLAVPLYEAVRNDNSFRMIPEAAMLCMVLDRACGGSAEEFNKLTKDPKGYEQLKAYVEAAGASPNAAVVARAAALGAPFVAPVMGLRGRYYTGQLFDGQLAARIEAAVNIENSRIPAPNNQQRDISARWTGTLLVNQPGAYVMYVQRAHAQVQLWMDAKPLPLQQVPGDGQSWTNAIVLSSGTHQVRVDLQFGNDGQNNIALLWSGPGFTRQLISTNALSTALLPAEVALLPAAINSLGSTNKVEFEAAKATILQAGGAGKLYLKNAATSTKGPVAEAAAKLLKP